MDIEAQVIAWLAGQGVPAYLVGGWVRDRLREQPNYDLDVVVDGDALGLARRLADHLGGYFFVLDAERAAGRVILDRDGQHLIVDIARFRGPDLRADLAGRDFTINALAAEVHTPETVIDHHGGLADLAARLLRPVSDGSIRDDPLRALRAVRLAAELGFALTPDTETLIRRDGDGLSEVAGERIRDELARLLAQAGAAQWLYRLDSLRLLTVIFPELEPLRGLEQSPPHHLPALDHSLATVGTLEAAVAALGPAKEPPGRAPQVPYPLEAPFLGPYGPRLREHLGRPLGHGRPRLSTLKLAALLHDTGKPAARTLEPATAGDGEQGGRIRFIGHEHKGAEISEAALSRLRFNRDEVRLARDVVLYHMRPLLLAARASVSNRAVYRFFRDTGEAGVDILLHALADHLATYPPGEEGGDWPPLVELTERMLADYWDRRPQRVEPPALVGGHDLLSEFGLEPGPLIGELLEAVREAQVSGQVGSREEALELVRRHLSGRGSP